MPGIFAGSLPGTVLAMVVFFLVVYSLRRKQNSNSVCNMKPNRSTEKIKCTKKDSLKQCLTWIFIALDNNIQNKTK
jgi:hypothetical protein